MDITMVLVDIGQHGFIVYIGQLELWWTFDSGQI